MSTATETSLTLTDAQLEDHLYSTIDQLDAWVHGVDVTDTLYILGKEYRHWAEEGDFQTAYGFWIDQEIKGELPRIPEELGYSPAGKVVQIHFAPDYYEIDKKEGKDVLKEAVIYGPREDQKYLAIAQGLRGALDYITLIEAGLLPKPDYIIGYTNQTMANFARRAGLKSVARAVNEMARNNNLPDDLTEEDYQEIQGRLSSFTKRFEADENTVEESKEVVSSIIRIAAIAKRNKDKSAYTDVIGVANTVIANGDIGDTEVVWGRYEDFRDHVLKFNKKFGSKVLTLAARELDKFGDLPFADESDV